MGPGGICPPQLVKSWVTTRNWEVDRVGELNLPMGGMITFFSESFACPKQAYFALNIQIGSLDINSWDRNENGKGILPSRPFALVLKFGT